MDNRPMQVERLGAGIFTIREFLTPEECASFIERSEGHGYGEAGIRVDDEEQILKDVRNNDRVIWDDPELTFMVYLNEDFEGGRTEFGWEVVAPATGTALVFPHRRRHRGAVVSAGRKYVLRTDVMYEAAGG